MANKPAKKPANNSSKKPIQKGKASPAKKLIPAKKPTKASAKAPAKAAPKSSPKSSTKGSTKSSQQPSKILKPAPRKALPKPAQPSWMPPGYRTLTPRLVVKDASAAIAWYTSALGAEEVNRFVYGGMCMHAELKIGDSRIHLNDQVPNTPNAAPSETNPTTCGIDVYVPDCDAVFARALENGASCVMPIMDSFWGDRCGVLKDPFGHVWMISTFKKAMTKSEIDAAAAAAFANTPAPATT